MVEAQKPKVVEASFAEITKQAESDEKPVLMRQERFFDPRKAPTLEAMTQHIREYKRIDLKSIMPKKYWDKIVHLGPPDVTGDPIEQAGNAGVVYFWVNFVRTIVEGPEGSNHDRLLDAEKAERVNIDRFSEMAKQQAEKMKVK